MNTLSIFTTVTDPLTRGDIVFEALTCYSELADEVVVIDGNPDKEYLGTKKFEYEWPKEFSWDLIGQQFQRGYEASTKDAVMHCDLDFIFHEKQYQAIREACDLMVQADWPALAFIKHQIFTPDRYNLKSRLVIAVNKARYGDRIRFDSGGDLAQPSLDGQYIDPLSVPQIRIPIWNYECLLKTKQQIKEDKGRFARAWQRTFGDYKLGGPDDESAYNKWLEMVRGRYLKHTKKLKLSDHPPVMIDTLKNLKPEQFGYDAFGNLKENNYV